LTLFNGDFYDADYFERGKESGKGWLEKYRWMPQRAVREALAFVDYMDIPHDARVLDVGCAKGNLVRALRLVDIDTTGCDISEYALLYTPYGCWNCTDDKSWNEHGEYTHIVIKDVLEHCSKEQLPGMLRNMAKVSDKMMVVIPIGDDGEYRIPEYHTEISHQIVENEYWWAAEFLKAGWQVKKSCNHVPGLKDNWAYCEKGNHVYVCER